MTDQASTTGPTRRRSYASSGLTYSKVARELGVDWCYGCARQDHETGTTTVFPADHQMVHWQDRRMTRAGLHRFLLLASPLIDPDFSVSNPPWLNLYLACRTVARLGLKFHTRFPRSYTSADRAKVRLWLRQDQLRLRTLALTPDDKRLLRRIRQWAKP